MGALKTDGEKTYGYRPVYFSGGIKIGGESYCGWTCMCGKEYSDMSNYGKVGWTCDCGAEFSHESPGFTWMRKLMPKKDADELNQKVWG